MSIPAGGPVGFATSKEYKLNGEPLTEADVTDVTITIFPNRSDTPVLTSTSMTFVDGHWSYTWDSTGNDAGIYEAKIEITTTDGFTTPRCERFSLEEC